MATVTVTKALKDYFNEGDGVSLLAAIPVKRPAREFLEELRAMTTEEKRALAQEVCEVMGDTLS